MLYWRTVRYLKPIQIYTRVWRAVRRSTPNLSPAPQPRTGGANWKTAAARCPSLIDKETFRFLGETATLAEVGWTGDQKGKLWRYHQHYFDDLNSSNCEVRAAWHRSLMDRWLKENAPGAGDGWEPYPTSIRIVNWIKWALSGQRLSDEGSHSLAVQARWVRRNLEYHLLGNHLIANAKALIFAGVFFEGAEADEWRLTGCRILEAQLQEQVLPDGVHFERSPMYHCIVLEDVLDVFNLLRSNWHGLTIELTLLDALRDRAKSMLDSLVTLCHPDGDISFFNDTAFDVAPSPGDLVHYAGRLHIELGGLPAAGITWLRNSGYVRLETATAVTIADVAAVGPDYLPGHAHADTLSFELSVHRERLVVNSGTSCYGLSTERLRQRGTAAHSTVAVARTDSSEVWSGFRVGRRARILKATSNVSNGTLRLVGAHDGYRALRGRPIHERAWRLRDDALVVSDSVSAVDLYAQARFHLHPHCRIEHGADAATGTITLPSGSRVHWRTLIGRTDLETSTWHPSFGASVPNQCIAVELVHGRSEIQFSWNAAGT